MRSAVLLAILGCLSALPAEDEFALFEPAPPAGVRLKDLIHIGGVVDNQVHGIGIVVGLRGTGDKNDATLRMLKNFLKNQNHQFAETDLESKNIAMVAVTADLPIFAKEGARLPVQVSSIGDAKSLAGGTLLQTALVAADRGIYAIAQGPVGVDRTARTLHETVAVLPGGAVVIREVASKLLQDGRLSLHLKQADFTTAQLVVLALSGEFRAERVTAEDAATVSLAFASPPDAGELVEVISRIESLRVVPDTRARVVLNPRTGTVVVGKGVSIGRAAVAHGSLNLRVLPQSRRQPDPLQPERSIEHTVWVDPITGRAADRPPPGVRVTPNHGRTTVVEGATVEEIANALNAMGASPEDLVAIFTALSRAGALHGELVVE